MNVTINVNNLTLCHMASDGVSTATMPDVCMTPSRGGAVPIPYPNIARSSDLAKGTRSVVADGGNMCANHGSEFSCSSGDEAGTAGGVRSRVFMKEATWLTFSFNVKLEGKGACRLTDKMFHNRANTVNMSGEIQKSLGVSDDEFCRLCKSCQQYADKSTASSKFFQEEYRKAGLDTNNRTARSIEDAVEKSIADQGYTTRTAGSTDSNGNITFNPSSNPCDKIREGATMAHERVHQATQAELAKKYVAGSPEFDRAWYDGKNWADDEVKAYGVDIEYMNNFKKECKTSCP